MSLTMEEQRNHKQVIAALEGILASIDAITQRVTNAKVKGDPTPECIRPATLDGYIGQAGVISRLRIAIKAAKLRNEPLEHVLLYGPPGLGKTTLSQIIAHEMGARCILTSGPAIEKPADLVGVLKSLKQGDVLFIDEIHRLPKVVEEFLYSVMEDYRADYIEGSKAHSRTVSVTLPKFTLVGATTRAGALAQPMRERFGMDYHLEYYTLAELQRILAAAMMKLNFTVSPDGIELLAARVRQTPRVAIKLLRRVRDFVQAAGHDHALVTEVAATLTAEGIDKHGLNKLDRTYLSTIKNVYTGGPVGVGAIAATISEEQTTLIDMVEPFLLKEGYIARTKRGRTITESGILALSEAAP